MHRSRSLAISIASLQLRYQAIFIAPSPDLPQPFGSKNMSKRRLENHDATRSPKELALQFQDLIGTSHVTDTALAHILSRVLPEAEELDRRAISKVAWNAFEESTRHGPVGIELQLPLSDGSFRSWSVLSPQAQLAFLTDRSPKLVEVLLSMRPPTYCSPWGILLYFDEVTPGNPLDAAAKRRKFWNVLWSFEELPNWARVDSRGWFLFGILRSQDLRDIPGGLAAVLAVVLKQFVLGPLSFPDAGVPLYLAGKDLRVYGAMRRTPSDGGALQALYGWMGAGGIKPCIVCRNCYRKDSPALDADGDPTARSISCTDFSKFSVNSDADLLRIQDLLAALARRPVTQAELHAHESALGFHFYRESWLQSPQLRRYIRPASMVRYDGMHIFFSDGIWDKELEYALPVFEKSFGVRKEDWIEYSARFCPTLGGGACRPPRTPAMGWDIFWPPGYVPVPPGPPKWDGICSGPPPDPKNGMG